MSTKNDPISLEMKAAEREKLLDMNKTARDKAILINELKSGLGDTIKKNPSKVNVIKKSWFQKLMISLKKVFTKF
jgi:hypothetical protein